MRSRKEIEADVEKSFPQKSLQKILVEIMLDVREFLNMIAYQQGAFDRSPIESLKEKEEREKWRKREYH